MYLQNPIFLLCQVMRMIWLDRARTTSFTHKHESGTIPDSQLNFILTLNCPTFDVQFKVESFELSSLLYVRSCAPQITIVILFNIIYSYRLWNREIRHTTINLVQVVLFTFQNCRLNNRIIRWFQLRKFRRKAIRSIRTLQYFRHGIITRLEPRSWSRNFQAQFYSKVWYTQTHCQVTFVKLGNSLFERFIVTDPIPFVYRDGICIITFTEIFYGNRRNTRIIDTR